MFVADTGNGAVKKISANGSVSLVSASFYGPTGVAVDGT